MAKELRCSDVGFSCEAVVRGESEDEIMQQVAEHAREVHGLSADDLRDPATAERIRTSIRDVG